LIFVLILKGFGHKKARNAGISASSVENEDKSVREERQRVNNENWNEQNGDIVRALDIVK
jgi:hypothetical protein